ncbi:MAG: fibronectin type III domain-containing protein, partial [Treponema sp.]|nr:fibronectin type III domain-containing protein [Treponema sp.]
MSRKKITAITLIGISLLVSACQFLTEPEAAVPGDGLVALRIGAGQHGTRSVLPSIAGLEDISWFSLYGTAYTAQDAKESWLADFYDFDDAIVYVRAGTWKFTLQGFSEDGEVVLQGSLQKVITEKFAETLNFLLTFADTAEGGTGFINIGITLPPDSGVVSVETVIDGTPLVPALEPDIGTATIEIVYEDQEMPVGDHLVVFSLYDGINGTGNLIAVITEIAVVRRGTWSEKAITLTATDLNGPPSAPSGLTATAWDGSDLTLSWIDNSWNETGFILNDGTTDYPIAPAATSYSIAFPAPASTTFRLKAVNGFGESAGAVYLLNPAAPDIPGGLSAGTVSSNSIGISWTAVSNALSYKIYRSAVAGGTYSEIGTSNTAAYTDLSLSPDTAYYYKVNAVNMWGESPQSSYVTATTRLPPPSGLSVGATTTSSIAISWTAVSSAAGYKIYRSNAADGVYSEIGTSNTAAYTNTGLSRGTTYYYGISTVNSLSEESEMSAYIAVTTRLLDPPTIGTELTDRGWATNTISSSASQYYYFFATQGTSYTIRWNDRYQGDGTKTGDVAVSAYWYSDNSSIFTSVDSGYTNGRIFTAAKSG